MELSVDTLVSFALGAGFTVVCYQLEVLRQLVAIKLKIKADAKASESRDADNAAATQELAGRVDLIEKALKADASATPTLTVVEGGKSKSA